MCVFSGHLQLYAFVFSCINVFAHHDSLSAHLGDCVVRGHVFVIAPINTPEFDSLYIHKTTFPLPKDFEFSS